MNYTNRLDNALKTAAWAHDQQGQYRKGTDIPYIIHPVAVMTMAATITDDEDVLIACLLHDVLEDVSPDIYSQDDMRRDFGYKVVSYVLDVTNPNEEDWRKRSELYLKHLEQEADEKSVIVSLADKTHNLMSVLTDHKVTGNEVWLKFTTQNSFDQLWWYESVLKVVKQRLGDNALVRKFEDEFEQLKAIV